MRNPLLEELKMFDKLVKQRGKHCILHIMAELLFIIIITILYEVFCRYFSKLSFIFRTRAILRILTEALLMLIEPLLGN